MFDTYFVMPEWEALITIASLSLTVLVTMVGNILVIISVFTHAPLKITPNFFIVSLAAGKSYTVKLLWFDWTIDQLLILRAHRHNTGSEKNFHSTVKAHTRNMWIFYHDSARICVQRVHK